MNLKRSISLFVLLLAGVFYANGQNISLPEDPIEFPDKADEIIRRQFSATDSSVVGISASWYDLSGGQQETVMKIGQGMLDNRMQPRPYFSSFSRALYYGVNSDFADSEKVGQFLDVTLALIEGNYKGTDVLRYFQTTTNLFKYGSIYYGKNSKVYLENFNYSIAMSEDGGGEEEFVDDYVPEEEPIVEDTIAEASDDFDDFEDDGWDDDWGDDDDDEVDDWDDNENIANFEEPEHYNLLEFGLDDGGGEEETGGPMIVLDDVKILIETPYDTLEIDGTSGDVNIFKKHYSGSGGTVGWQKHGFAEDVYTELSNYSFDLRRPQFTSENSKMSYPQFFDKEVDGVYHFKSVKRKSGGDRYPKFHSYTSDHKYKTIRKDLTFKGGFNLVGKKIHSAGLDAKDCYMTVDHDGKKVLRASSKRFFIEDSIVVARRTNTTILLDGDSLWHPQERAYSSSG